MCDLVCDRYAVLQVMSRFGIALGFGDKTVAEVCAENEVDASTFLAVVNLSAGPGAGEECAADVSVRSLLDYLHNSHGYFLDFRLPHRAPPPPAGHPAQVDRGCRLQLERRFVRYHALFR